MFYLKKFYLILKRVFLPLKQLISQQSPASDESELDSLCRELSEPSKPFRILGPLFPEDRMREIAREEAEIAIEKYLGI